jgi:hypothetical protein
MKFTFRHSLSALLFVCTTLSSLAQEDSLRVMPKEAEPTYEIPAPVKVNLSMITPPQEFQISPSFDGYINFQSSSAIMMTLIDNVNYVKIKESVNEDWFKSNGLTKISEKDFVSENGVHGSWYKSSFSVKETDFYRYTVFAGDLKQTLMLNITFPVNMKEIVENAILLSINSINFNPTNHEE